MSAQDKLSQHIAERLSTERLHETIADLAYYAGQVSHFTGDSREDIQQIIKWAHEFDADQWQRSNF